MELTLDEKIELLEGLDVWHTKHFNKLSKFMMADGPHGLRKQLSHGDNLGINGSEVATLFPTASLLASSFDRNLLEKLGNALANQAKSQEVNMVLGPGINIKRTPLCGRNFEYFSEDPYLTGELASSYVRGVESNRIGTSVKHFFANNQETNRLFINTVVDERALHEIYLKAFKRVIKEKPASIMASYNKINGYYGTEHPIINNLLRNEWGYKGVVVSDWGAIDNRLNALKEGTDLEMPSSKGYYSKIVKDSLSDQPDLVNYIDESTNRIIEMINKYQINEKIETDFEVDHELAIKIALESMVLLKNDNILPLSNHKKTVIIGGFIENIRTQGGGSSHINPYRVDQINEIYQSYFEHAKLSLGYELDHDGKSPLLFEDACKKAKESDQVIYLMGLPERLETEGIDRKTINLPKTQVDLLKELYKVNQNIVVVLLTGSVVDTSYKDYAKGILLAYLPGEGGAHAILKTLIGESNPSGRLPETWIENLNDVPKIGYDNASVYYDESIFVGYRKYSSFNIKVNYPFGYGLSYSKLTYDDFKIEAHDTFYLLSMKIKNESEMDAKEVIQVYLETIKSGIFRPKKELVAFDKVEIKKQKEKLVEIKVYKQNLTFYDVTTNKFVTETGNYKLNISKNVDDVIHAFDINLEGNKTFEVTYHEPWKLYKKENFSKLFNHDLPPKNIIYKKPFDLSTPLFALKGTFMGRRVVNYIIKEATKQISDSKQSWMRQIVENSLLEMPLRSLASFGSSVLNFEMVEGIADLASNKLLKGIKKIKRGQKDLKHE
ncbi:beta-glucosidase [Acholeplasma hippikon]|nr:glycoside hydrolase family 3 C-terminal domain-containing protein [Acholeplasma hippikon]